MTIRGYKITIRRSNTSNPSMLIETIDGTNGSRYSTLETVNPADIKEKAGLTFKSAEKFHQEHTARMIAEDQALAGKYPVE
jgi:hypothetical protein